MKKGGWGKWGLTLLRWVGTYNWGGDAGGGNLSMGGGGGVVKKEKKKNCQTRWKQVMGEIGYYLKQLFL